MRLVWCKMKINQHFHIPDSNLHGLTVKDNQIVSTFLGSVPDCMVEKTQAQLTNEDKVKRDKWWNDYSSRITGSKDPTVNANFAQLLWGNNVFALSPVEFFALTDSLENDFVVKDKAQGLVNWLGGAGVYNGTFQKYPCWNDPESYLDAQNITTEQTKTPWNVGALLTELKKKNPAAHSYILRKAFAKAKKTQLSDDSGYSAFNNQTAKKVQEAAKKVAETAIDIPLTLVNAATDRIDEASWIIKNIKWIAIATVLGGGYLAWRNRKDLAELVGTTARAAITKGK